ncbi:hypothetical protein HXY33_05425 [Candidatus Bathyarchaeota archaeon]|nr:hypothetical protein [Candidatus Bathyarchaeota archaeon]
MNVVKFALPVLGIVFLVFGLFVSANYAFRLNSDRDWGERQILYDLGFIGLGLAFELVGLGLILVGNAVESENK